MIPFSVLDLAPIGEGSDATAALGHSLDLARQAERLGYARYWVAEHHNMPGIGSAATAVVIGHVAAGTRRIRVGAGGIMLPNHAPLVIAEQFGTLAALFPGRIDLGVGRAPGTDPVTSQALRRGGRDHAEGFPQDVVDLMAYFKGPVRSVQSVPGIGQEIPVWILGSSLFGAQLAAALGLPFAFASHFAPAHLEEALNLYRTEFRPTADREKPYAMACIQVCAAETDERARSLFTSLQQSFRNRVRGAIGLLPRPIASMDGAWSPEEEAYTRQLFREAVVGSRGTVAVGLGAFIKRTAVDELMITAAIHDHAAAVRSLEIVADIRGSL